MSKDKRKPSMVLTEIMSSITEEDKNIVRRRMIIAVKISNILELNDIPKEDFSKLLGE